MCISPPVYNYHMHSGSQKALDPLELESGGCGPPDVGAEDQTFIVAVTSLNL